MELMLDEEQSSSIIASVLWFLLTKSLESNYQITSGDMAAAVCLHVKQVRSLLYLQHAPETADAESFGKVGLVSLSLTQLLLSLL